MTVCLSVGRLYVSHNLTDSVHVCELAAAGGGGSWSRWKTDGSPWGLSVTPGTCYLLVTMRYAACVDEFSPDGRRLRRIDLGRTGTFSPWHTVLLNGLSSQLVVGHGDKDDDRARVALVRVLDGRAVVERWYGGQPGSDAHLLTRPQHLAVGGRGGTLAVVDVFNDRVVLLDDQLHRVGVVAAPAVDRDAGWLASRTCWVGRRLCVAEVQSPDHHRLTAARLSLYDVR